jgi:nicotinamide riboside transporter PnuC
MKTTLQILAFLFSIGGTYLAAKKKRICWILLFFGGFFWIALYLISGLYIAIGTQVFYIIMNVFGWIEWGKKKENY